MFKKFQHKIALKFTIIISLLVIITGISYTYLQIWNSYRDIDNYLISKVDDIKNKIELTFLGNRKIITQSHIERISGGLDTYIRILDENKQILYIGEFFKNIPTDVNDNFFDIILKDGNYRVYQSNFINTTTFDGYIDIVSRLSIQKENIHNNIIIMMIASIITSIIIYIVSSFFTKQTLIPAEKMFMQLEQFTYDASHELYTPLSEINLYLDLALKTKNFEKHISNAKKEIKTSISVIKKLLELTKIENAVIDKQNINISRLLNEILDNYKEKIKLQNIKLITNIQYGIKINGDKILIQQMFKNLIDNAIKFSRDTDGNINITLTNNTFTISNNGKGIPQNEMKYIFNRFYRTSNTHSHQSGYGIGLTIVKQIIDLHQWKISVDSNNEYTIFTILFKKSINILLT